MKKAGYDSPTRLQQTVIPIMLRGRDIAVVARSGEGRTAGFLVPLILGAMESPRQSPYGLVVCSLPEDVGRTAAQLTRLTSRQPVRVLRLGNTGQLKKEVKQLQKNPQLIMGTAGRIIDHVRRNTIRIKHARWIIIMFEPSARLQGFDKDVEFILSKAAKRASKGLFSSEKEVMESLLPFLRRPRIIASADSTEKEEPLHSVLSARDEAHKRKLLVDLILAKDITHTVIYCRTMAVLKSAEKHIAREIPSYAIVGPRTSRQRLDHIIKEFEKGGIRYILTVRPDIAASIPGIREFIFYSLPAPSETFNEICSDISHYRKAHITTLFTNRESADLCTLQENHAMKKEHHPEQNEIIKGKLKAILHRIHETDPDELQRFKKLIKKHIPITRRAYVGALLLKESLGNVSAASGPMQTLFVNIGKNRRVFPKDLSRFFCKTLNVGPNEIGAVRVLDNYSFVEVSEAIAGEAVKKMDGTDYRGRTIVVNFAKKKD